MNETSEILTLPRNVAKGTPFTELVLSADKIQADCKDFMVSNVTSSNVRFSEDTMNFFYLPDGAEHPQRRDMSRHAMSQLCNRLGVPIRYIEKCIDTGNIDLAADNLNTWLSTFGRNLFIREHEDRVRGVLSDRYMTLDTPDILDVVSSTININDFFVKGHYLSPERFHARIVQKTMMNVKGEDLFAGIQIDSSDVGRSTLVVRFMIFKQVCTNGLCISKGNGMLFEQRHVGINKDEFYTDFKESIKMFPELIAQFEGLVDSCRKESSKYNTAHFDHRQMQEFIDSLRYRTKVSEESAAKIINIMQEKYSPSQWGLINAITEVAQDFTLERRVELEKIAGELLLAA